MAALVATPNLVALYQEDVADAFDCSALQSIDSPWDRDHVYHETGAAVAGNGFGLCHDFEVIKPAERKSGRCPLRLFSRSCTRQIVCVLS
jgi:hypothetical protein